MGSNESFECQRIEVLPRLHLFLNIVIDLNSFRSTVFQLTVSCMRSFTDAYTLPSHFHVCMLVQGYAWGYKMDPVEI